MESENSLHIIEDYLKRISEIKNSCKSSSFFSSALKLNKNDSIGRFLETVRDVPEGELLIREPPLVVSPSAGAGPTCLRCCKSLKAKEDRCSCPDCGAPVCKELCRKNYHSEEECNALKNLSENPWNESRIPLINMALTPLRAWLKLEEDKTLRPVFMSLESFAVKREKLPIGRLIDSKIVPLLRDILKQSNISRDFIHHSCGAFDTNAFKVKNIHEEEGRAVMPLSAMLMHECVPNSEHWFDDGYLIVRAAVPIPRGSVVSITYTSSMLGTQSRQKHLSFSKLFLCQCRRCKDVTELGTHVSSVLCRSCKKGLLLPPIKLEQNSNSDWQCTECSSKFPSEMINTMCRAGSFTTGISEPEDLIDRIQDVQRMVGVQHFGALQLLVTLIRVVIGKSIKTAPPDHLVHVVAASEHLLPLAAVLEPGLTLFRGELLLANLQARAELSLRQLPIGTSELLPHTPIQPSDSKLMEERLSLCARIHELHPVAPKVDELALSLKELGLIGLV